MLPVPLKKDGIKALVLSQPFPIFFLEKVVDLDLAEALKGFPHKKHRQHLKMSWEKENGERGKGSL